MRPAFRPSIEALVAAVTFPRISNASAAAASVARCLCFVRSLETNSHAKQLDHCATSRCAVTLSKGSRA